MREKYRAPVSEEARKVSEEMTTECRIEGRKCFGHREEGTSKLKGHEKLVREKRNPMPGYELRYIIL